MDRRTFGFGIAGMLVAPTRSSGQSARLRGKIGYIHPITISPSHSTFAILREAWRRLGYLEGQTVLARSAEGDIARLPGLVTDLVAQDAGVLIAVGADAVRAAARTTKSIPIVAIDLETDPVETGLIVSYARPGGNITGLFMDLPLLATKWIELMREAVPGLERIAFAWQPSTGREQLDIALRAARTLGVEAVVIEIDPSDDFAAKFSQLAGPKQTGIVQLTVPGIGTVAPAYAAAAEKHGLPTMTFLRATARAGIMMSYGPSQETYFPRAVDIADRILRGEAVGDVPIERPSKFEFVVNLKTAKALGLTIPAAVLLRADEVIE